MRMSHFLSVCRKLLVLIENGKWQYEHLIWFVYDHRKNSFANNAGVVCSYCQLLADITAFPELYWIYTSEGAAGE